MKGEVDSLVNFPIDTSLKTIAYSAMWLCLFSCRPFEDTFEKIFEETFENAHWRKIKEMQPVWLCLFWVWPKFFEGTHEEAQIQWPFAIALCRSWKTGSKVVMMMMIIFLDCKQGLLYIWIWRQHVEYFQSHRILIKHWRYFTQKHAKLQKVKVKIPKLEFNSIQFNSNSSILSYKCKVLGFSLSVLHVH